MTHRREFASNPFFVPPSCVSFGLFVCSFSFSCGLFLKETGDMGMKEEKTILYEQRHGWLLSSGPS